MYETEVELAVGQTVQVGEVAVTILDIDGDAIRVRIDPSLEQAELSTGLDMRRWLPPR